MSKLIFEKILSKNFFHFQPDGHGVDINIDFGNVNQFLEQQEVNERFRSIGRMLARLKIRIDRIEVINVKKKIFLHLFLFIISKFCNRIFVYHPLHHELRRPLLLLLLLRLVLLYQQHQHEDQLRHHLHLFLESRHRQRPFSAWRISQRVKWKMNPKRPQPIQPKQFIQHRVRVQLLLKHRVRLRPQQQLHRKFIRHTINLENVMFL